LKNNSEIKMALDYVKNHRELKKFLKTFPEIDFDYYDGRKSTHRIS